LKLRRELGILDVFCIATGTMVSSGIFVLPGLAHARAGPSIVVSYLFAGVLAVIGMLNAAELATAMPKAGGDYFFITRSLGPAVGSISGLLNWFALSLKSAFALIGMAAFVRLFLDIDMRITGVVLCGFFVMVNLWGTRHAGRLQVILVTALIVLMIIYIVRGIPHVKMVNLDPFVPYGFHKTLAAAGFIFVAYGGLIKISSLAEEVREPSRTIPYGILLSLVSVTLLYTLMVFVTTGVLSSSDLDASLTPITEGASSFMGIWGVRAIGLAAIFAFVSTANAGVMAASRYLFALSRDELLPHHLSRLGRKSDVPYVSIIVTGIFIAVSLFLKLDILVEAASLVLILGFILSCLCVIVLRESRVQNYRPSFRAPFYPFMQLIGILAFCLLIFELGLGAFLIFSVLFIIGVAGYWFYGRKRVGKDYALLHVVARLTARELVSGTLEQELKEIVRERDEIALDRFDEIVGRCHILDIPESIDFGQCCHLLADALSVPLGVSEVSLARKFIDREKDSSTVLSPFLAVPHIVIQGSGRFEVVLIRAKKGIRFSEANPGIRAVFVLAGTADERNFHLRALANIAQIAQESDFETRWMNARGKEGIRDVVLLGKRKR
jgi:amino acid transporter/mannitol/fructose-specific phosphotransferase system IIA component (Ntr-type)